MRTCMRLSLLPAVLALVAVLAVAGCGGTTGGNKTEPGVSQTSPGTTPSESGGTRTFTIAELAKFNGQNGMPAYIAVDGIVYDVSGKPQWPEGDHTPCNLDAMAGKDLSVALQSAPSRMRGYVMALPVVGRLGGQ